MSENKDKKVYLNFCVKNTFYILDHEGWIEAEMNLSYFGF